MSKNKIRVIFRESKGEFGHKYLDCIFIDSMPECNPGNLTCYAHIGQHSECSIDWLYETKPAVIYDDLLKEIASIYHEYELEILDRLPPKKSLRMAS